MQGKAGGWIQTTLMLEEYLVGFLKSVQQLSWNGPQGW